MSEGTSVSMFVLAGGIIFGLFVLIVTGSGGQLQESISDWTSCAFEFAGGGEGECGSEMDLELPEEGAEPEVRVHEIKGDKPSDWALEFYGEEFAQWRNDRNALRSKLAEIGVGGYNETYGYYQDGLGIDETLESYKNSIKDWDGNLISEREDSPYVEYVVYDDNGNATDKYVIGNKDSTVRMIFDDRQLPEGNTYAMGPAWGASSRGRYSVLKDLSGDDDGITYIYGLSEDKFAEVRHGKSSDRIKGYRDDRWD